MTIIDKKGEEMAIIDKIEMRWQLLIKKRKWQLLIKSFRNKTHIRFPKHLRSKQN